MWLKGYFSCSSKNSNMSIILIFVSSILILTDAHSLNQISAKIVSAVTYGPGGPSTGTTTTGRPGIPSVSPSNVPSPTPQGTPQIDVRGQTPSKLIEAETLTRFGNQLDNDDGVNPEMNDGDVTFPREKRQTACGCYAPAQCNNTGNTDGTGLIDFRIISGGSATCAFGLTFCCPSNSSAQVSCGSRFTSSSSSTLTPGQARYGDFPWMALLQNSADGSYVGGGILIDQNNVLTTAHRIARFTNGNGLRIRLGEWDMNSTTEQYPYRDFTVGRLWVHESFNAGTLQNDVALIRLSASVTVNPPAGITPICMPTTGQNFESQRCWVAGWGVDQFVNGRLQSTLRAADVPIITPASCESSLRSTRLGNAWSLDRTSFICAGGEQNKDSCTGDGGSGLVCEVSTGRWVLAGLVAWGIGCATQGVPAAYVNVVNYLPWIQSRLSQ